MATKKELIKMVLEDENNKLSERDLEQKTNRELEFILEKNQEKIKEVKVEVSEESIRAEMEAKIRAEMEAKIRAEIEAETKSTARKEIDRHRLVPVMNLTNGKLVYLSKKSGNTWKWTSYGDVDEMEFHELQSMRTNSKAFISDPMIMILDEEISRYMGLEKMYENLEGAKDLDEIFSMNNKLFAEFVERMPKSIVVAIVTKAREKEADGSLESNWKIKYLNEKFDADIGKRG